MLPVLLLVVLCGFGLTYIGRAGRVVLDGIDSFAHMLFAAFSLIMRVAPLSAFSAMAFTVGRYGTGSIGSLGLLIGTFYAACIFFVAVVVGLVLPTGYSFNLHGTAIYLTLASMFIAQACDIYLSWA